MGDLKKSFGGRVRQLRQKAGLTQEEVADLAGLDWKYLGGVEAGKNVTLQTIERLAKALKVSVRDLFIDAPKAQMSGANFKASVLSRLIADLDPASRGHFIRMIRHFQRLSRKAR